MLRAYNELIHTTQEGLDYLTDQYAGLPSPQAPGVFQDVLTAFQQLNVTHEKMCGLMESNLLKAGLTFPLRRSPFIFLK
ncbi:hypothetical protein [Halobacillus kuroshimensis]|uniref:hypothetical protein n=1 Tax=Halobacillus kuroshimensis TaxID=302481 RepID=UPI0004096D73|nr:hypothetical protein [Halobacillus kuroshimensis]